MATRLQIIELELDKTNKELCNKRSYIARRSKSKLSFSQPNETFKTKQSGIVCISTKRRDSENYPNFSEVYGTLDGKSYIISMHFEKFRNHPIAFYQVTEVLKSDEFPVKETYDTPIDLIQYKPLLKITAKSVIDLVEFKVINNENEDGVQEDMVKLCENLRNTRK
jgi:hypothetical protein